MQTLFDFRRCWKALSRKVTIEYTVWNTNACDWSTLTAAVNHNAQNNHLSPQLIGTQWLRTEESISGTWNGIFTKISESANFVKILWKTKIEIGHMTVPGN